MRILIKDNNRPIAVLYWDSAVIRKYDHHHDKLGRFASADGGGGGRSLLEALSSLSRHRPGDKVEITEQAIQKVPEKASEYLSDEENKALHDMNVSVLTESMKNNNSNEVGKAFDGTEYSDPVFGDQYSVDIEADPKVFHMLVSGGNRSVIITHNHPGKSTFSARDLSLLLAYPSIKSLAAIINSGKSYHLVKTRDISEDERHEIFVYARNISESHNEAETVEMMIKRLYTIGIRYER